MPTTDVRDFPYPSGDDIDQVAHDMQQLAEALDDALAAVPYREACGTVVVNAVLNTASSASISFPVGRFTQTPIVHVTQATTAPQLNSISGSATSTTAGSVTVYRTSATANVTIAWRAVQMTAAAAAG